MNVVSRPSPSALSWNILTERVEQPWPRKRGRLEDCSPAGRESRRGLSLAASEAMLRLSSQRHHQRLRHEGELRLEIARSARARYRHGHMPALDGRRTQD